MAHEMGSLSIDLHKKVSELRGAQEGILADMAAAAAVKNMFEAKVRAQELLVKIEMILQDSIDLRSDVSLIRSEYKISAEDAIRLARIASMLDVSIKQLKRAKKDFAACLVALRAV